MIFVKHKRIEIIAMSSFILAAVLAFIAHKKHWKIADVF